MVNIKWMIIIILLPSLIGAQNWEQLGKGTNNAVREIYADTIEGSLYVGGNFKYIGNPIFSDDTLAVNGIAKWTGMEYLPLATGQDYCFNICNPIISIYRFKNEIYCNTSVNSISGVDVKGIARWNGFSWHPVGEGLISDFGYSGNAYSQMEYQGNLLAGGPFIIAGTDTAYTIARWDGMDWHSMNFPGSSSAFISAMAVYNDELYVAGNFKMVINGELTYDVARFDGTQWHEVGGGLKGNISHAADLIVFKNELYIGGYFRKSDGNAGNMIMKLQNGQWVDVAGGVEDQVHDMLIYKDELYVVGVFSLAGFNVPVSNIAKWTGEKWCGLGSVFNNRILTAEVFNGDLYIGGGFNEIDGEPVNYIAKWIGGDFTDPCGEPVSTSTTNENREAKGFPAYPNPVLDFLYIDLGTISIKGNQRIKVFDMLGREMHVKILSRPGDDRAILDLMALPSGIYMVNILSDNVVFSQKVIKL